jgi:hypothetical protein
MYKALSSNPSPVPKSAKKRKEGREGVKVLRFLQVGDALPNKDSKIKARPQIMGISRLLKLRYMDKTKL